MEGLNATRFKSIAGFGTLFWLAGLSDIFLKHLFLDSGLYLAVSRIGGRVAASDLTVLEKLGMFRHDIWQCLFIFPVVASVILLPLKMLYRRIAAYLIVIAILFLFFINLLGLGNVGRFLTLPMMLDAVSWGWGHPEYITEYISLSSILKLIILLIVFITLVNASAGSHRKTISLMNTCLVKTFPWLLVVSAVVGGLTYIAAVPAKAVYPSAAGRILAALRDNQASAGRFSGMTMNEVSAEFARVTQTPSDTGTEPSLIGAEKGSNVILFVLETGPARAYHPLRNAPEKVINDLLPHSFVSTAHYSTYPYTSDALFSVFSGLYPLMRRTLLRHSVALHFGWVQQLQELGYETKAYAPYRDTFENDTKMFQMFGFKDRYLANGAGNVPSQSVIRRVQETLAGIPNVAADEKLRGHLEPRLTLDLMALERLEDDIRAFNAKGQPFVAAFMPQMGHGPWLDLVGTTDVTKRGEAIVRLQLKWLESLVEQLRASGALAKTVIVLTADHGVRTTQEDPSFIPSTLSDYSFEVPFLIFAPNALHGTKIIPAPTSHVDIGPTLLTLLGVEHSRWPMQGTVIWNPHLHDRLLYFFAADYYGSDGTCSKGLFVSCSVMTEECRRNNRFEFPPTTSLPPAESQNALDFLRDAGSLQERIAELLSTGARSSKR